LEAAGGWRDEEHEGGLEATDDGRSVHTPDRGVAAALGDGSAGAVTEAWGISVSPSTTSTVSGASSDISLAADVLGVVTERRIPEGDRRVVRLAERCEIDREQLGLSYNQGVNTVRSS
jgi:hypothetical protein